MNTAEWRVGWSPDEREAIKNLAIDQRLSIVGVIRQAVRLYQLHMKRLKNGETCTWSGDEARANEFKGDKKFI